VEVEEVPSLAALEAVEEEHHCLALAGEEEPQCWALEEVVGLTSLALEAVVELRMWEAVVEGRVLCQQVQAVQDEMLLAVEGAVLAEHCSLVVEEGEVMCRASSVVREEAPTGCFAKEAEVGQGRDSEVEAVHLKALGCL
jgi:hypothetical protein